MRGTVLLTQPSTVDVFSSIDKEYPPCYKTKFYKQEDPLFISQDSPNMTESEKLYLRRKTSYMQHVIEKKELLLIKAKQEISTLRNTLGGNISRLGKVTAELAECQRLASDKERSLNELKLKLNDKERLLAENEEVLSRVVDDVNQRSEELKRVKEEVMSLRCFLVDKSIDLEKLSNSLIYKKKLKCCQNQMIPNFCELISSDLLCKSNDEENYSVDERNMQKFDENQKPLVSCGENVVERGSEVFGRHDSHKENELDSEDTPVGIKTGVAGVENDIGRPSHHRMEKLFDAVRGGRCLLLKWRNKRELKISTKLKNEVKNFCFDLSLICNSKDIQDES